MTTQALSKERLEEVAELARKATYKPCALHMSNLIASCDSEMVEAMARALLAAHEQEPSATLFKSGDSAKVIMIGSDLPDGYTDVFAHPAPSIPAEVPEEVTDMKLKKAFLWIDDVIRHNPGMKEAVTCRAAMLQSEHDGWIPVSERLPGSRESVLLWDADLGDACSGHYSHETGNFYQTGMIIDNDITHWQPLPAAPKV